MLKTMILFETAQDIFYLGKVRQCNFSIILNAPVRDLTYFLYKLLFVFSEYQHG